MPFLNFVSGLLVFFIGISLFKDRLFTAFGWKKVESSRQFARTRTHAFARRAFHSHAKGSEHSHSHDDSMHTHDGVNYHSHLPPEEITWKSLLALGISGGLLPCPSALVLMLSAISLGRVGYGMILTVAFSFGLAATLTAVGLVFLYVGKAFGGSKTGEKSNFQISSGGKRICHCCGRRGNLL